MNYVQLIIQNKVKGDRFLSQSVYTLEEIKNNVIDNILIKEYINRYPDERLLSKEMLHEEIKNMEVLRYVKIKEQQFV